MRERKALTTRIGGMKTQARFRLGSGVVARCLLLACLLLALPAGAQQTSKQTWKSSQSLSGQSAQSGSYDAEDSVGSSRPIDSMHREIKEKQIRELRKQRYSEVVANTEELLRLATELNAEVSASNSDRLTADQRRTLARIEKLARNVKDAMVRPVPAETGPTGTPVVTLP